MRFLHLIFAFLLLTPLAAAQDNPYPPRNEPLGQGTSDFPVATFAVDLPLLETPDNLLSATVQLLANPAVSDSVFLAVTFFTEPLGDPSLIEADPEATTMWYIPATDNMHNIITDHVAGSLEDVATGRLEISRYDVFMIGFEPRVIDRIVNWQNIVVTFWLNSGAVNGVMPWGEITNMDTFLEEVGLDR